MLSNQIIVFLVPFLNRIVGLKSENEIRASLIEFSKFHKYNEEEVNYYFVLTILKNDIFFKIESLVINLFFEAAYWASLQESRQKIRPKSIDEIQSKNCLRVYTKLTQFVIEGVTKKYYTPNEDNILYKIELNKYIEIMHEISCLKRSNGFSAFKKAAEKIISN